MDKLVQSLQALVQQTKTLHENMFVHSVKDATYRKYTIQVKNIMTSLNDVLDNLLQLDELNTDMYICYENDIYLSLIKKRYVISQIKDGKVKVLGFSTKLQKALEIFYSKAYGVNKKYLKNNIDDN